MRLHRFIWLYETGEWPEGDIDHINGDRADNRWENLRCVSNCENHKNMKRPADNTSGIVGVSWHKARKKWTAYINISVRKRKHLGIFETKEEAISARKVAEIEYGYCENHGRG